MVFGEGKRNVQLKYTLGQQWDIRASHNPYVGIDHVLNTLQSSTYHHFREPPLSILLLSEYIQYYTELSMI